MDRLILLYPERNEDLTEEITKDVEAKYDKPYCESIRLTYGYGAPTIEELVIYVEDASDAEQCLELIHKIPEEFTKKMKAKKFSNDIESMVNYMGRVALANRIIELMNDFGMLREGETGDCYDLVEPYIEAIVDLIITDKDLEITINTDEMTNLVGVRVDD